MKYSIIMAAAVLVFSGAALAEDAGSHAVHHPNPTQAADQKAAQAPSPTARPTKQATTGMNNNCPMMGSTNGPLQQHMSGSMPNTPSGTKTGMGCPAMQQHPKHTMTIHHDSAQ